MKKKSFFSKEYQEIEIGEITYLAKDQPLLLESGKTIKNFPIAYQTYGKLNQDKSNAILICHALTSDQYVANKHPVTKKDGWWNFMVGSGKTIDTDKYFVICSNVLGGCMGTLGPKEINPDTNKSYNLDFPIITIDDMVKVQKLLIQDFFKIKKLYALIGGSMGGMQVLSWASKYPELIERVIAIATSTRHSAQNIAFHEVARQAIMADNNWHSGNYIDKKLFPSKGLAIARMTAHITYLSEKALDEKFGRNLQDKKSLSFAFSKDFQIENYLNYQGINFVDRFDANSYIYATKAMDYFDLASEHQGDLNKVFKNAKKVKFCLISFSDDWFFPPEEMKKILNSLNNFDIHTSFANIKSSRGHDSFLLPDESYQDIIQGFLDHS